MSRRHKPIPSRRTAPAPAAAGHRPLLLAMALAAGFSALPARAQPTGAQAIVGSATLSQQGSKLVVTTQNGAGTSYSSINWQSFSVPAGTTTHFAQPGVTSTSINRVVGPDPSAIFGTLSSNGRLVLVNPAGITVGAGAVVDTAAFTASTLRMSDADALAGRQRFGDGSGAALRVDGQVLARQGDVVLIGQNVQAGSQALIQSPQGATILAAGQKVEVTGRGLEGIVFEVQAPADQAVNLGTLRGDAVGVFAGTLKHSGLIQAQAVSTEGGRVVLRAADMAQAAGAIQAQGLGGAGGSVDVLGSKVGVLAGASIDTSNTGGGGRIRVGGDYQGGNADVPNAQVTYVDRDALLRANATAQGDGGRVIVWADDTTRAYGRIEAKAGAQGGNGGFVETSGKRFLDVNGIQVDASAAHGTAGTWLLDPTDIYIVGATPAPTLPSTFDLGSGPNFQSATDSAASTLDVATLNAALLSSTNVTISTSSAGGGNGDIIFSGANGDIDVVHTKNTGGTLTLQAQRNIEFESGSSTSFRNTGSGSTFDVQLQAGNGIHTGSGATVSASTSDPASKVVLTVAGGKTWTNDGTLTLNQNGLVGIDAATFVNNGMVNGAAGAFGGFGGALGSGLFDNRGTVAMTQGVFKVGTLRQTPAPTASPAPAQPYFAMGDGTAFEVTSDFAVSGGSFDFYGGSFKVTQQSGDLKLASGSSLQASGAVQLTANAGAVTVERDIQAGRIEVKASGDISTQYLSTLGVYNGQTGNVTLDAGGSVGYSQISSSGDGTYGSAGGAVTIKGSLGVAGGTIVTEGFDGGNAGAVTVSSQGDIDLSDTIYASGGYSSSGSGGAGGTVTIVSSGGKVSSGRIDSYGGGSSGSLGAGGNGGAVSVTSQGDIDLWGGIDTSGSYGGSGKGGAGGRVTIVSNGGRVSSAWIDSYGGSSGSLGAGGNGGAVSIASQGDTDLWGNIDASGGSSSSGNGGTGGAVTISGSAVQLSNVSSAGGDSGNGAKGGDGGAVNVTAASSLSFFAGEGSIETEVPIFGLAWVNTGGGRGGGKSGGSGVGGAGGNAGAISFTVSNGPMDLGNVAVEAYGGDGGTGSSVGGNGGSGGAITLQAVNGAITTTGYAAESLPTLIVSGGGSGGATDGSAAIDRGGRGGDAKAVTIVAGAGSALLGEIVAQGGEGGYASYAGARGGDGGNGAAVTVSGPGPVALAGGISASGGAGGLGADPSFDGAAGSTGTFTTNVAGGITIPSAWGSPTVGAAFDPDGASSLNIDARWTNNASVVMAPYAWVVTTQPVTNNGTLDLGYGSVLSLGRYDHETYTFVPGSGSFTNAAGGVLKGEGTVEAETVFNAGTLLVGDSASNPYNPIGTFSIAGNLVQQATGKLVFDIAANTPYQPGLTYDQLRVSGSAVLDGTLQVNAIPAVSVPSSTPSPTSPPETQPAAFAMASALPMASSATGTYVLMDVGGTASGSFSSYAGPGEVIPLLQMSNAGSLQAIPGAVLPPPPAPSPAPMVLASDPLVDKVVDMLNGSASRDQVQAALNEQDNLVTQTLDLLLDEEERQKKDGAKGEVVYTDTACKPS